MKTSSGDSRGERYQPPARDLARIVPPGLAVAAPGEGRAGAANVNPPPGDVRTQRPPFLRGRGREHGGA